MQAISAEARSALFFKALSHPERIRLVVALAGGPLCVSQLHGTSALDFSSVSRHVKQLAQADVVEVEPCGREKMAKLKNQDVLLFLKNLGVKIPVRKNTPRCAC